MYLFFYFYFNIIKKDPATAAPQILFHVFFFFLNKASDSDSNLKRAFLKSEITLFFNFKLQTIYHQ